MNKYKQISSNFIKFLNFKTFIILFLDAFIIASSFLIAIVIKNDMTITLKLFISFLTELPIIIIVYWASFVLFQMYSSIWKFAGLEELVKGVLANGVAILFSFLIARFVLVVSLSGSYYAIAFFVITFTTLFSRLFYRVYLMLTTLLESRILQKKALIVGAGAAGYLVYKEIELNPAFDSKVVGFIDDDISKRGKFIHSIPVVGTTVDIETKIKDLDISVVYIAIPQASKEKISELLNTIEKTGAQIKLFPPFYEVLEPTLIGKPKLRDINIEDLLGRKPIVLEEKGIKEYINSKTIVVTGGGGSIGSELCRQLRRFSPKKLIIVDIYENNAYDLQMEFERLYRLDKVKHKPEIIVLIASVRDVKRIDEIFEEYKPDVVFHAAAHKHVPLMEGNPKEAIKNNVLGTYNVAKMADKHSVSKFVLVSTDKAVNPTNVMGATKRFAERVVMWFNKNSETDYAAVRFGNVLGSNGSVIPLFKKQIEEGGPITVTHKDITRYFMTIPEACQLVIQAGAYAKGGELFVLDMGKQIKIVDLAEKLIRLSGYEPYKEIKIEFSGLRPGEKMYEELLIDFSRASKTDNDKIFVDPDCAFLEYDLELEIQDIKDALDASNNQDAIELLKQYIETYKNMCLKE